MTHIARVKPSLLINHLLGELWIFVVAQHHIVSLAKNLSIFGDFKLYSIDQGSHTAQPATRFLNPVDGNNRRSFGESVHVDDL